MPPHDKPNKKLIDVAAKIAISGIQGLAIDRVKPDEFAAYCLAVAKDIVDGDIDEPEPEED